MRCVSTLLLLAALIEKDAVAQPPKNDVCSAAIELTVNDALPYSTSNFGATAKAQCNTGAKLWKGVWFTVQGTGELMSASTCFDGTDLDTTIDVFASCAGFCMHENYPSGGTCHSSSGGYIRSWYSDPFVTYYIMVAGTGRSEGNFEIAVRNHEVPRHGECGRAVPLELDVTFVDSTHMTPETRHACSYSGSAVHGVWYSYTSPGGVLSLNTCHPGTNIQLNMFIIASSDCDSSTCAPHIDNVELPCENGVGKHYAFKTASNQHYFIFIGGASTADFGDFELSASLDTAPVNSQCSTALALSPTDDSHIGSTVGSAPLSPWCGSYEAHWPGNWYSVMGNGNLMSVSTCNPTTMFKTDVWVHSDCSNGRDTCAEVDLIQNGGDECKGKGKTVTWQSRVGTDYKILVTGQNVDQRGKYEIETSQYEFLTVGGCNFWKGLKPGKPKLAGTTLGAGKHPLCGQDGKLFRGVFYLVRGTGTTMTVTTCFPDTNFPSAITLMTSCKMTEETCVNQERTKPGHCKTNKQMGASVEFESKLDKEYYVFVHGLEPERADHAEFVGNFAIAVQAEKVPQPENEVVKKCAEELERQCTDKSGCNNMKACFNRVANRDCTSSKDVPPNVQNQEKKLAFEKASDPVKKECDKQKRRRSRWLR